MAKRRRSTTIAAKDILVIDDDTLMRDGIADLLEEAGYTVRAAADGSAGLEAAMAGAPALVVTDIFMPGTSGMAVISELRRMHPATPIIAISGRFSADGMDPAEVSLLGASRVLAKPFTSSDLLAAVAELLASASQGPSP